jgi:hypothetical protein
MVLDVYRYSSTPTGCTSDKLGMCEVCGKKVNEVFLQSEERRYAINYKGVVHEGWTGHKCNNSFGHEECMLSIRKNATEVTVNA